MSMSTQNGPAQGAFMTNAQGHLVPKELVKPIDMARDQLVQELFQKAEAEQEVLRKIKQAAYQDIEAFVEMSAEEYGVKRGGKKGNVTLHSFDGK